jgi:hypothetical protein
MKTYVIYSFDDNDEPVTVTIECATKQTATLARQALRDKGILTGGSVLEKITPLSKEFELATVTLARVAPTQKAK